MSIGALGPHYAPADTPNRAWMQHRPVAAHWVWKIGNPVPCSFHVPSRCQRHHHQTETGLGLGQPLGAEAISAELARSLG